MRGLAPTLGENMRVWMFVCSSTSCGNWPKSRAVVAGDEIIDRVGWVEEQRCQRDH